MTAVIRFDELGCAGLFFEQPDQWGEANCCECGKPIRWVLDMFSFAYKDGDYLLGHARCLWTPGGFDAQKALASGRTVLSTDPEEGP